MKTESLKFKRLLVLYIGLIAFGCAGFTQTYTESKKIIRSFPVFSDTRLDITNKYGKIHVIQWKKDSVRIEIDLFVRSTSMGLKGTVTVSLSNGDIKVNRLEGQSNINLNFGNGIINHLNNATINLVYSDFEIKSAGQISLESKSSKIRIYQVDILKIQSSRDKYTISELNNFFGDSYFSDIWIYKMNEEVNFTPRYGDLKIDSVRYDFSYININSEYADLYMVFSAASSFYLDIDYHPDVAIRIPDGFGELEKSNEGSNEIRLYGRVGKTNSSSRMEITAPRKCIITLEKRKI